MDSSGQSTAPLWVTAPKLAEPTHCAYFCLSPPCGLAGVAPDPVSVDAARDDVKLSIPAV
jgi:hypothetical protein